MTPACCGYSIYTSQTVPGSNFRSALAAVAFTSYDREMGSAATPFSVIRAVNMRPGIEETVK